MDHGVFDRCRLERRVNHLLAYLRFSAVEEFIERTLHMVHHFHHVGRIIANVNKCGTCTPQIFKRHCGSLIRIMDAHLLDDNQQCVNMRAELVGN